MLPTNRIRFLWVLGAASLIVVVLGLTLATGPVHGQGSAEAPSVTRDEINQVARELWCPLCSGVRLDSCELKACAQMRDVIAIKLSEGEDTEAIKDYFVNQYGPQVLGEPPRQGFNWLAWILPVVVLVGGGVFVWNRTRQLMGTPDPAGSATDTAPADTTAHSEKGVAPDTDDEELYQRKLEEELTRYG